jgi:hypothetical protein
VLPSALGNLAGRAIASRFDGVTSKASSAAETPAPPAPEPKDPLAVQPTSGEDVRLDKSAGYIPIPSDDKGILVTARKGSNVASDMPIYSGKRKKRPSWYPGGEVEIRDGVAVTVFRGEKEAPIPKSKAAPGVDSNAKAEAQAQARQRANAAARQARLAAARRAAAIAATNAETETLNQREYLRTLPTVAPVETPVTLFSETALVGPTLLADYQLSTTITANIPEPTWQDSSESWFYGNLSGIADSRADYLRERRSYMAANANDHSFTQNLWNSYYAQKDRVMGAWYSAGENLNGLGAFLTRPLNNTAKGLDAMFLDSTPAKDRIASAYERYQKMDGVEIRMMEGGIALDGAAAVATRGASLRRAGPAFEGELKYLDGVNLNAHMGKVRQNLVESELRAQYPNATIQSEVYLRTASGARAIDPLTGTARRIDSVVIQNGRVLDSVEVTSLTANKRAQILKEQSIRNNGGTFIRDRATGQLIDIGQVPTQIIRRQ